LHPSPPRATKAARKNTSSSSPPPSTEAASEQSSDAPSSPPRPLSSRTCTLVYKINGIITFKKAKVQIETAAGIGSRPAVGCHLPEPSSTHQLVRVEHVRAN
jgi:hypothetical protein